MNRVHEAVRKFYDGHTTFRGKGPLSVATIITRRLRRGDLSLPVEPDDLLTAKGGQVARLSGRNVNKVLQDYGITRKLASEGGRTSRGSIENAREYATFLNTLFEEVPPSDTDWITLERFWASKVQEFFDSQPFVLDLDPALGLSVFVREIIGLAQQRQRESGGTQVAGAVLQHIVGAKLQLAARGDSTLNITHHSFTTADQQAGRSGDFLVGDSAIHVTTYPGDMVMHRCQENIMSGVRPVVVTISTRLEAAKQAAEAAAISDRVDIFDVEQFVALNVYEWSGFSSQRQPQTVRQLLDAYNTLIDAHETDPSLKISLQ